MAKLDKYEQEIEQNISQFEPVTQEKKLAIEALIDNTNDCEHISLQLKRDDFELLKQKANLQGLSYQELVSSIIHKFVSNQLFDKTV
jgi:predicted DNA binding CopG/RHH family protein